MMLGNYDRLITLQRPVFTKNGIGERVQGWERVADVYASVKPIRQVEQVKAGGNVTVTSYTIRIHKRPDVLPTWSALDGGKLLQFQGVIAIDRLELEIVAVGGP